MYGFTDVNKEDFNQCAYNEYVHYDNFYMIKSSFRS